MKKLYEEKPGHKEILAVAVYMLLFLLMCLWLAVLQPIEDTPPLYTNPPDEHSRYLIPTYICQYGKLPDGTEPEVQIPYYGGSYALFPGLSYIVMGMVMRAAGAFGADAAGLLLAARSVNILYGLLMAFFVWLLGRRLFSKQSSLWAFCCGVMYLPQQLFLHSYVNVESMCMLSIAVMLYALVRMRQEGIGAVNSIVFAVGAVLCSLSYYNAYGYLLMSIGWFVLCCFCREKDRYRLDVKKLFSYGGLILLIWCAGAGWWFVRNAVLLNGDVTGMQTLKAAQAATGAYRAPTAMERGIGIIGMLKENDTLWELFRGFVAAYGSRSVYAGIKYYYLYALFFLGGFLGLGYPVLRDRKRLTVQGICAHALWLFACGITFSLWLFYCYTTDYQVQGRYVLPCTIPVFLWVTMGYEALSEEMPLFGKMPYLRRPVSFLPAIFSVFMLLYFLLRTAVPAYL
ncbi:MAG: glycosyltransferase family 39 protein [Lachnospiraceae bacterium]|nr:glycosyltransferase family 39 protein [Lachnospiraceae bacterium]